MRLVGSDIAHSGNQKKKKKQKNGWNPDTVQYVWVIISYILSYWNMTDIEQGQREMRLQGLRKLAECEPQNLDF